MFIRLLILNVLVFVYSVSFTQDVRFTASTDATQIIAGNYFEVTFTLENARGGTFSAPSFVDFEVLSGPNRSTQMSIVNGQVSQKMAFSFTLTSEMPGNYRIGPATIDADGKTYRTQPIDVVVIKRDPNTSSSTQSGNEHFIRIEVSDTDVHIGQQVTLKYVLYTTADVRSYNFTRLPDFEGFFAQEIQNYSERPVQVVEDGIQYVKRPIKVVALFPQQKGVFAINPAKVNIGVATRGSRSSFFFNTNLKPVALSSESIDISVSDIKGKAPMSYSGGVGYFQLSTSVDKRSIQRDDAVTLTFQIRGDGDNKFVLAPKQPFYEDFEIYDPNLLREHSSVRGARIELTKTYEYLLVPKHTGKILFTPELTYYNVDSNAYVTLKSTTYELEVLESAERRVAEFEVKQVPLPPIFTTTELKEINRFIYASRPYWLANGILALGFVSLLLVKNIQLKQQAADPAIKRFSKAKKVAVQKLSLAKKELDMGNTTGFYAQLRKSLMEYLSDKTGATSAQLSKEEVRAVLTKYQQDDLVEEIIQLLIKGEQALYASIQPGADRESYDAAIDLIEKMETAFKK